MQDNRLQNEAAFQDLCVEKGARKSASIFYKDNKEVFECFDSFFNGCSGSLLVYGCGAVDITRYLDKGFQQIIGIDISPESVRKLKAKIAEKHLGHCVKVYLMDAHSLSFADHSFDYVIGQGILHHLDIERAMVEIHRVLKDSGRCLFLEPLGLNPIVNIYRFFTPHLRTKDEHPLTPRDFKMIRKFFTITETRGFYLFAVLAFGFRVLIKSDHFYSASRFLLRKLDLLLLSAIPPSRMFCWITIFTARKRSI